MQCAGFLVPFGGPGATLPVRFYEYGTGMDNGEVAIKRFGGWMVASMIAGMRGENHAACKAALKCSKTGHDHDYQRMTEVAERTLNQAEIDAIVRVLEMAADRLGEVVRDLRASITGEGDDGTGTRH